MKKESRTYKTIKNSVAALLMYVITLILSFVSRGVLIKYLGAEVLGLNTTASSLLGFLNLTELGIGTAIAFTLYKPLQQGDKGTINEIVSVQGWMYRMVAYFIIVGSLVLMCFFPRIFAKTDLPLWYAYASYSVLLFSSLLGYFVNYKQIVLSASQQQYKIQYSYNVVMIVKTITQIIAVAYLPSPYIWWLIIEVVFAIIASIALGYQINITFPWLHTDIRKGRLVRKNYSTVIVKIKQLFVHKIGMFALTQTSPLIIYAYATLTMVTNYSNYMVIITGVTAVIAAMFSGMNAGVGNLVAEGNSGRIVAVFKELFSSRFLIIGPASICLYLFSSTFVTYWLGGEFVLGQRVVLLIVLLFFIRTTRETVDSFINAYGLFSDIWAPALEAALNIGCSVLFGYYWGLEGILLGVLVSQFVVVFCWKPIYLFMKGMPANLLEYVWLYIKHIAALACSVVLAFAVYRFFHMDSPSSLFVFVAQMGSMYLMLTVVLSVLLFVLEQGFRDFVSRVVGILLRK